MNRGYRLTLVQPSGAELDLTSRLDADDLGTITEQLEEGLLELTMSDWELSLVDEDGTLADLLSAAQPGERWEVWLDRETGRRRPKWERLFGGILDVPYSVEIDRGEKRVSLQVFAYLKTLERTAEPVRREVVARYGETTASSAVMTVSGTAGLEPEDEITVQTQDLSETQRIKSINHGTGEVTTYEVWANTFNFDELILNTPYHRNRSIPWLVGQILDEAGLADRSISITRQDLSVPVATTFNNSAIGVGTVRGVFRGTASVFPSSLFIVVSTDGHYRAANPVDGFASYSGSTTASGDWTPYMSAAPAAVEAAAASGDLGERAFDHVGGFYWSISWVTVGVDKTLKLYRDGVFIVDVQTVTTFAAVGWDEGPKGVEFNQATGHVWISAAWTLAGAFLPDATTKIWNGTTLSTLWSGYGGSVRHVAPLGIMMVQNHLHFTDAAGAGELRFYSAASSDLLYSHRSNLPFYRLWTARAFDRFIGVVYQQSGEMRCACFRSDRSSYPLVLDSTLKSGVETSVFGTRWTDPATGTEHYVVALGTRIFVLAAYFAGVLDYASFEGLSCAKALRDLAVLVGAYVNVDEYGVVRFGNRALSLTAQGARAIPVPLDRLTIPVGEFFITSCEVRGEDGDGNSIEVVAGDSGDSEHRLSIDSQLVQTVSLAYGIGAAYVGYFNVKRDIEDIEIAEPEVRVRPWQHVTLDDRPYLVVSATLDLVDETQRLRLIELTT